MRPGRLFVALMLMGMVAIMATTDWLDPNWRYELSNAVLGWLVIGVLSGAVLVGWFGVKQIPKVSLVTAVTLSAVVGGVFSGVIGGLVWVVTHSKPTSVSASSDEPHVQATLAIEAVNLSTGAVTFSIQVENIDTPAVDDIRVSYQTARFTGAELEPQARTIVKGGRVSALAAPAVLKHGQHDVMDVRVRFRAVGTNVEFVSWNQFQIPSSRLVQGAQIYPERQVQSMGGGDVAETSTAINNLLDQLEKPTGTVFLKMYERNDDGSPHVSTMTTKTKSFRFDPIGKTASWRVVIEQVDGKTQTVALTKAFESSPSGVHAVMLKWSPNTAALGVDGVDVVAP